MSANHTVETITGRRVKLVDGRVGIVQSAYGSASGGVDSIDVLITERPGRTSRHPQISAATRRQRVVGDLDPRDVTVLPR